MTKKNRVDEQRINGWWDEELKAVRIQTEKAKKEYQRKRGDLNKVKKG